VSTLRETPPLLIVRASVFEWVQHLCGLDFRNKRGSPDPFHKSANEEFLKSSSQIPHAFSESVFRMERTRPASRPLFLTREILFETHSTPEFSMGLETEVATTTPGFGMRTGARHRTGLR
jgi:hypothetical protein